MNEKLTALAVKSDPLMPPELVEDRQRMVKLLETLMPLLEEISERSEDCRNILLLMENTVQMHQAILNSSVGVLGEESLDAMQFVLRQMVKEYDGALDAYKLLMSQMTQGESVVAQIGQILLRIEFNSYQAQVARKEDTQIKEQDSLNMPNAMNIINRRVREFAYTVEAYTEMKES